MPFKFSKLEIPDVVLIEPQVFEDRRGFLMETYKASDFRAAGIEEEFLQDAHTKSSKGVVRGLHYQLLPAPQAKTVRVIQGAVWDVVVDIRKGSPTYGRWVACELSAANKRVLFVPNGFAHGFCVLEDDTELLYKFASEYNPELERGIRVDDPEIGIEWPVPLDRAVRSERDGTFPGLRDAQNNFEYDS